MSTRVNRRTIFKGAAGAAAAAAVSKASPSFAAPAAIQSSPIEITYWGSFSGALGEQEKAITDRFNTEQSAYKLNYQFQGTYEETAQKLTAALQAGDGPDVCLLSDVWWFKFYLAGALAPLDDMIAAHGLDTADYVDSLIGEGFRNGHQYWMPFARSTPLFYYNVDAFKEIGLDAAPDNWDDFVAIAPQLVKKDGDTITRAAFAHPSAASYSAWLFQPITWAFGGAYSDDDFNIKLTEEGAIAAGEFWKSTTGEGWATTPDDVVVDFTSGLTAAIYASTGALRGITNDATFEFRTANLLKKGDTFGCCTGGAGLAIMANAAPEKQEGAFAFIEWVTSPANTAVWSQNTGYMPVRKSAVEEASMVEFFAANPNFKTAVDQLALTRPQDVARTRIPGGDQIIGSGIEQILIEQADVTDAFADVAATLEEEAEPVREALAEIEA